MLKTMSKAIQFLREKLGHIKPFIQGNGFSPHSAGRIVTKFESRQRKKLSKLNKNSGLYAVSLLLLTVLSFPLSALAVDTDGDNLDDSVDLDDDNDGILDSIEQNGGSCVYNESVFGPTFGDYAEDGSKGFSVLLDDGTYTSFNQNNVVSDWLDVNSSSYPGPFETELNLEWDWLGLADGVLYHKPTWKSSGIPVAVLGIPAGNKVVSLIGDHKSYFVVLDNGEIYGGVLSSGVPTLTQLVDPNNSGFVELVYGASTYVSNPTDVDRWIIAKRADGSAWSFEITEATSVLTPVPALDGITQLAVNASRNLDQNGLAGAILADGTGMTWNDSSDPAGAVPFLPPSGETWEKVSASLKQLFWLASNGDVYNSTNSKIAALSGIDSLNAAMISEALFVDFDTNSVFHTADDGVTTTAVSIPAGYTVTGVTALWGDMLLSLESPSGLSELWGFAGSASFIDIGGTITAPVLLAGNLGRQVGWQCNYPDTDADGIADYLDLDSDNDGISDLVESGAPSAAVLADANNDGTIALAEGTTSTDGLWDVFAGGTVPDDSEASPDGFADYLDLDSDDDGIPDATEARPTNGYVAYAGSGNAADSDDDGILDIYDTGTAGFGFASGELNNSFIAGANTANADADDTADTIPDYLDTDSDGDLIDDVTEAGTIAIAPTYADPDGSVDDPAGLPELDGDASDVDFRSLPNQPPAVTGVPATFVTDEDITTVGDLSTGMLAGITDPEGDTIVIDSINGTTLTPGTAQSIPVANGTVEVDASGVITFVPAADYNGPASFPYTVTDGSSSSAPITFNGTVNPINDPPIATADGPIAVTEDVASTVNVISNGSSDDSDAEGDALSVTAAAVDTDGDGIADPLTLGSATPMTDASGNLIGTMQVDANGDVTFTPEPDYVGPVPVVEYTISDPSGDSAMSTAGFADVTNVNDAPVANDDGPITAVIGGTINIDAVANDTDADLVLGDILTITEIIDPAGPTVLAITPGATVTLASGTQVTMLPDGTLDVTAPANSSAPESFDYTLADTAGATSQATVSLEFNQPPAVTGVVATFETDEDITTAGDLSTDMLAGITDPEGDPIVIDSINGTTLTPGTAQSIPVANGTVEVDASGVITFVPAADYNGPASFPYTVTGGSTSAPITFNGTVNPINDPPIATADGPIAVTEDVASTVNVISNGSSDDSDAEGDALSVTAAGVDTDGDGIADPLTLGSATPMTDASGNLIGTMQVDANGDVTFIPEPDYVGPVPVVEYTISDPSGDSAMSTASFADVTNVNDAPVANDDGPITAVIGGTINIDAVANDTDADLVLGDILTITEIIDPAGPTVLAIAPGATVTLASGTQVTMLPDGTLDVTAPANSSTPESFDYTLADTAGATSQATVSLEFNQPPAVTGVVATFETDEDITTAGDLSTDMLAGITDPEGDTIVIDSINGTTLTPGTAQSIPVANGTVEVDASGVITFVPVADYNGPASFPYTITDGNSSPVPITFNGTVNPINDPPIATADGPIAVTEDVASTVNVISNGSSDDSDIEGDALSVTAAGVDTDGDGIADPLTLGSATPMTDASGNLIGTMQVDANGDVTFIPEPDYVGPVPVVEYTISDPSGDSAMSTVSFADVTNVSDAPVANDDGPITAVIGGTINIDAVANDTDADLVLGDILTITEIIDPAGPTVVAITPGATVTLASGTQVTMLPDGTLDVTAPANSSTPESFDYTLADTAGATSQATVSLEYDTDGDTITDAMDLDDDNDGIPDAVEGSGDTDGDGIPDSLDLDSDNDGLTDTFEAGGADADGDGIIDGFTDNDGDGLDDNTATMPLAVDDTDNDGQADYLDVDSDNDGITDTNEADAPGGTLDADGDGVIDGFTDANGDGLNDATATTPLPVTDTDADGQPDHLELDSDNDGLNDILEAGGGDIDGDGMVDGFIDAGNDGLHDGSAGTEGADFDSDGIPNEQDVDSDGDGIPDAVEAANGPVDSDGDGQPDHLDLDSDNDGISDNLEAPVSGLDSDGDGIDDIYDADQTGGTDVDGDGVDDVINPQDTDADGVPDYLDVDSDNDGITDLIESGGNPATDTDADGVIDTPVDANGDGLDDNSAGTLGADTDMDGTPDVLDLDSDGDGIPDAIEGNVDTDGDGIPDYQDLDSDNDGIPDAQEAPISGVDTDGDGIDDVYDVDQTGGTDTNGDGVDDVIGAQDTDGDGSPDYLDLDSDADGIDDIIEGGLTDTDGDGVVDNFSDANGDGVDDLVMPPTDDTDGDGIPNYEDPDSDGDGIPDAIEGTVDTDGDGIPDYLDLDSDNDGLPDADEGVVSGVDTDGDGIDDAFDVDTVPGGVDADGDGIADGAAAPDTDGDGVPDYQDIDSDNDGIPDVVEAGGIDADGDGVVDNFTDIDGDGQDDATVIVPLPEPDTDSDGIPDHLDIDSDNDGLTDATEAGGTDLDGDGVVDGFSDANNDGIDDAVAATPLPIDDSDGDGVPDYQELDSDNDGIPDAVEAGTSPNNPVDTDGDGTPDYQEQDSDNDGIPDSVEAGTDPTNPVDTDADGTPDYLEQDSDNDGIPDSVEAGVDPTNPVDTDADGTPDYLEQDSDNDGIPDSVEAGTDPTNPVDTDADGTPDYLEQDSDNDGIPDSVEAGTDPTNPVDTDADGTPDYLEQDSDNDGIPDSVEAGTDPANPVDTDADGTPDYLEQDSDNDGIPDSVEAGVDPTNPIDTDADGTPDYLEQDSDNDGIPDSVEAGTDPTNPVDTDADGTPDYLEQDSDNDGIPDSVEAGTDPTNPVDTDADGTPDYLEQDSDNDGIPDSVEAGTDPANPVDTDADGTPDYLEQDSDNDGIPDSVEAGVDPTNPIDTDADGTPDYLEQDSDNDGIPDSVEAGTDPTNPVDTDADGTPDYLEQDSDNDGIPDSVEAGTDPTNPVDTDGDGTPDYLEQDSDNDGIPDSVEAGTDPANPVDTDADGTPDYLEQDSDNDGIPDTDEAGSNPATPVDTDGDGMPDFLEPDSDNDGIPDDLEGTVDTDGDGTPDYLDQDSDNDGILDALEAGNDPSNPADSDGDGIPDFQELDSDNDGLPDSVEAGSDPANPVDTDGDGVMDFLEPDSDNDGIPDSIEAGSDPANPVDTDGDGTPDYLDLDSDNDGIPDTVEAGPIPSLPFDTDGDGISDFLEQDSDNDGIPDNVEAGSTPTQPVDTDGDGVPDYQELDSDNDGTPDNVEAGSDPLNPVDTDGNGIPDYLEPPEGQPPVITPPGPLDSDGDGIPDTVEGLGDSDGDGVPDYLDIDSDNDGLIDTYEAGESPSSPLDTDGDGIADYIDLDSDNDGLTDVLEAGGSDADGDGVVDGFNDLDGNGHDDATAQNPHADPDFDGDGHVDRLDLDSDNDGLPDVWESIGLSADANGDGYLDDLSDLNGDGLADNYVSNSLVDTDDDSATNHLDLDSDGDGASDLSEAGGDDLNADGLVDAWTDSDGDGVVDAVDVDITGGEDRDADGIDDFADADFVSINDSDGDGIIDLFDGDYLADGYLPFTVDGETVTQTELPDGDGNGVADVLEPNVGPSAAQDGGIIHTGLAGSGCSVIPGSQRGPLDPMMMLLMFGSVGLLLGRRSRRSKQARHTQA